MLHEEGPNPAGPALVLQARRHLSPMSVCDCSGLTPSSPEDPAVHQVPAQPAPPAPPLPPRNRSQLFDPDEVRRAIPLLEESGQVFEVRILKGVPETGWGKPRTFAGYFTPEDVQELIKGLGTFKAWSGVYITLNSVDPALRARSAGRIKEAEATASDGDIVRRRFLLLDFDPVRPSGISSSDFELQLAMERAKSVRGFLDEELDWPAPLLALSGNGAHLLYRVDLPAEDSIVGSVLRSVATLYSDKLVEVDRSVFSPAQLTKLYGTMACKGDSIKERPHRLSRILEVPDVH